MYEYVSTHSPFGTAILPPKGRGWKLVSSLSRTDLLIHLWRRLSIWTEVDRKAKEDLIAKRDLLKGQLSKLYSASVKTTSEDICRLLTETQEVLKGVCSDVCDELDKLA